MPWVQLLADTTAEHTESVENALLTVGAQAVTLQDRQDQPLLEPLPGETPLWDAVRVIGLFDAHVDTEILCHAVRNALPQDGPLPALRFEALEDRDWQREWMKHYQPMAFGERLWVCPSWCPPPQPDAVNLMLDPGLAFGTGTHPTTALCLRWLDGQNLTGKTLLDYGCGSGILAVAGALLGCEKVLGVDIDPQALLASRQNAERNAVQDRLSLSLPEDYKHPPVDVIVANILAGPLVSLAPAICAELRPNGALALSGLLRNQVADVQTAYSTWIDFQEPRFEDDWVCLSGIRKR